VLTGDPHSFEWNELYTIIYACLNHGFPEEELTSSNNHHAASKVGELERNQRIHVMKPADKLTEIQNDCQKPASIKA
jgi:hypothetical protein